LGVEQGARHPASEEATYGEAPTPSHSRSASQEGGANVAKGKTKIAAEAAKEAKDGRQSP